jgi:hypothetical protein
MISSLENLKVPAGLVVYMQAASLAEDEAVSGTTHPEIKGCRSVPTTRGISRNRPEVAGAASVPRSPERAMRAKAATFLPWVSNLRTAPIPRRAPPGNQLSPIPIDSHQVRGSEDRSSPASTISGHKGHARSQEPPLTLPKGKVQDETR